LAALSIIYTPRLYTSPLLPLLSAAYNNSIIICRQSITVPPSFAAAPPPSCRRHPPLLYITIGCLPSSDAAVA
jgi:hypothetical protein